MYRPLILAALLAFTGVAAVAQCEPPLTAAGVERPAAELIRTSALVPGEQVAASLKEDKPEPRRSNPAMLVLVAVALMSGIALRRYSAGAQ